MNPLISPVQTSSGSAGQWGPPGTTTAEEFGSLLKLGMDAIEQADVDLISNFADLWIQDQVRNQPIRMNRSTLVPELGQATFSDAADAWRRLRG
jgi:hypothetical protein